MGNLDGKGKKGRDYPKTLSFRLLLAVLMFQRLPVCFAGHPGYLLEFFLTPESGVILTGPETRQGGGDVWEVEYNMLKLEVDFYIFFTLMTQVGSGGVVAS